MAHTYEDPLARLKDSPLQKTLRFHEQMAALRQPSLFSGAGAVDRVSEGQRLFRDLAAIEVKIAPMPDYSKLVQPTIAKMFSALDSVQLAASISRAIPALPKLHFAALDVQLQEITHSPALIAEGLSQLAAIDAEDIAAAAGAVASASDDDALLAVRSTLELLVREVSRLKAEQQASLYVGFLLTLVFYLTERFFES